MPDWKPASPFEERLGSAFAADDLSLCLGLLRNAQFALPISPAAAAGAEPVGWPVAVDAERTWILAYTSTEAMWASIGNDARHHRVVSLTELAAGWPDLRWGLSVNSGLPVCFFLESGTVARLAVPSLAQDRDAEPDSGPPILQKPLTPRDLHTYLAAGESRVSGYCHHALDVAHIATPTVLVDALGQQAEKPVTDEGSVNLLRWFAAGLDLYRTPYGGTDEETRAAVAGWVIEEPPFVGMGLVPNVDQVIREYRIHGVGLPHGAEIWELTASGVEHRRAVYDGDLDRWMLVHLVPPGGSVPLDGDTADDEEYPDAPGEDPAPPPTRRWCSYRARWRGADHQACPEPRSDEPWMRLRSSEPVDGFQEVEPGLFVKPVRAGDCEAVHFVTTVGEWRGATCQVHGERGEELLVEYPGGLLPVAGELGLERVERGVHRGWVPRRELLNLREHAMLLHI